MIAQGYVRPSGGVSFYRDPVKNFWQEFWRFGVPHTKLPQEVFSWRLLNLRNLLSGAKRVGLAHALGVPFFYGKLYLAKWDGLRKIWIPYGLAGYKVVTTAGVGFLVDAWQNSLEMEIMRYHAIGTGNTAEASGDTALVTELTTEYTGNVRATGTLTEGASANIFRSVGTNTLDSGTPAITEHGLMSQAATGGGTLWDRTVFSAVNLNGANGDGLQSTYDATFVAGG